MDEENIKDEGIELFEQLDEQTGASMPESDSGDEDDSVRVIKESAKEVTGTLEAFKREQRVNEFLNDPNNVDYKEYSSKIKELALKPEAKGLTVNAIANMVVPKDYWIKKGATLAEQAKLESQENVSGGNSSRNEGSQGESSALPDPNTLSKADFEKQAWDIARGIQP